jgi:putative membrane protein
MRRVTLALFAVAVLVAGWLGLWRALGSGPFAAHMLMHMGVVAVAAPLAALALAGSALDPVPHAQRFFAAVPASLVELCAVWAWHAPGLHHFARHTAAGLVAEQATFLCSALWVWLAALGGRSGTRTGAGILALLLTSMHMTLLGALLALAQRPLYAHVGDDLAGALDDQQLGGAIMLLVGGVAYLAGGLGLARGLLHGQRPLPWGGARS